MLMPVRCFSCGKELGSLYEEYVERTTKGEQPRQVMENLGVQRYCCKRMIFTHVGVEDEIMLYEKY